MLLTGICTIRPIGSAIVSSLRKAALNICRQGIILNLTMYPMAPMTTKPTPTAWLIFKNSLRSGFVQRFRKFWPSLRLQFSGAVLKEQGNLCKAYRRNSRGVSRTSLIIESDIAVCKEAGDEIFCSIWCKSGSSSVL